MKIKEVCDKTGLTERAVRLYLEKGLVHPQSQWRQGRTYHDYQQQDIQRLTEIAALRRVGFSLEEIAALLQQNQQVDIILEHHCRKLEEETRQSEQQAQLLGQLAETSWPDGSTLARAILRADTSKVPVDTEPDFGRADTLTREEKQQLARQVKHRMEQADRRRHLIRKWGGITAALLVLLGSIAGYQLWQEYQPLSMYTTMAGPVQFSPPTWQKDEEDQVQMTARVTLPEQGLDFLGVFREASGSALCKGYFPDTDYAAISIRVDIPRRTAREMGLMQGEFLDFQKVWEQIAANDRFCLRYLTVEDYQAELS